MLYWFDTEFLERGNDYPIIPISIGMIREDGAEYYAEVDLPQKDWDDIMAHPWLPDNVVKHLTGAVKPQRQIAEELRQFVVGQNPRFWAYCNAYDWVVLNQLYGTMMDHPTRWPFFCNELSQYAEDNKVNRRTQLPVIEGNQHNAMDDARWVRAAYDEITRIKNEKILRSTR